MWGLLDFFCPNIPLLKRQFGHWIYNDWYEFYKMFFLYFFFFFFFKSGCLLEWTKSGLFIPRKCLLIIFISSRVCCRLCIGNCFECLDNSFWTNQKYELVIYCEFWGNKFDRENYKFLKLNLKYFYLWAWAIIRGCKGIYCISEYPKSL